jgi:hypothetical protein
MQSVPERLIRLREQVVDVLREAFAKRDDVRNARVDADARVSAVLIGLSNCVERGPDSLALRRDLFRVRRRIQRREVVDDFRQRAQVRQKRLHWEAELSKWLCFPDSCIDTYIAK